MWELLSFLGSIVIIIASITAIGICGLVALAGLKERYCAMCNKITKDQQRLCSNCELHLVKAS